MYHCALKLLFCLAYYPSPALTNIYVHTALQIFFSNPPGMVSSGGQTTNPTGHSCCCLFLSCFPKNQNIRTIDIFLIGNCVMRELYPRKINANL